MSMAFMVGELLPVLAQQADKYSIIRSMTHGVNAHETAAYMVQTGARGRTLMYPSTQGRCDRLAFKGYDAGYKGLLPPYIVLTEPQGRFSEAGFLGPRFTPFATGGDPARQPFAVEGVVAQGMIDAPPAFAARIACTGSTPSSARSAAAIRSSPPSASARPTPTT